MIVAASVFDRAQESLGESLPRFAGAILLLVFGLLVASIVGRVLRKLLLAVGLDDLGERFNIHDALEQIGLDRSLSALLARAIRIALAVTVIVAAVSLLGLGVLSTALNELVLFLPKLLVALALVLVGVVVAQFVGERVARLADQLALGGPLPQLAQGAVLALFVLTALAQVSVPTAVLTAVVAVVVVAVTLTLALAFGLGGRDVARQISAGRYVSGAFELGQTITVAGLTGQIVALESAATVLRTPEGRRVRVPNQMLIDSVVTVDAGVDGQR